MSYLPPNTLFPTGMPLPNGVAAQINDKPNYKNVFVDVTPMRTPYLKSISPNVVDPMKNNFVTPEVSKDVVYENIKPVFTILRIMGVIPLTKSAAGLNEFNLMSPAMIYSIVIFSSLVGYILYLSLNKVQILRTADGKFEEAVIEYLFTVYLFPLTAIPIMWYETRKISNVLNSWIDFEVK